MYFFIIDIMGWKKYATELALLELIDKVSKDMDDGNVSCGVCVYIFLIYNHDIHVASAFLPSLLLLMIQHCCSLLNPSGI